MTKKKQPATAIPPGWKKVVFSADCDEDGNCPQCGIDFGDCSCPGPTQEEEYDYEEFNGELYARAKPKFTGEIVIGAYADYTPHTQKRRKIA